MRPASTCILLILFIISGCATLDLEGVVEINGITDAAIIEQIKHELMKTSWARNKIIVGPVSTSRVPFTLNLEYSDGKTCIIWIWNLGEYGKGMAALYPPEYTGSKALIYLAGRPEQSPGSEKIGFYGSKKIYYKKIGEIIKKYIEVKSVKK